MGRRADLETFDEGPQSKPIALLPVTPRKSRYGTIMELSPKHHTLYDCSTLIPDSILVPYLETFAKERRQNSEAQHSTGSM